jgi:hypothetical protein
MVATAQRGMISYKLSHGNKESSISSRGSIVFNFHASF